MDFINSLLDHALPNKLTRWYVALIHRAQSRGLCRKQVKANLGYVELHHILPKSFYVLVGHSGSDVGNKVYLTPKEHFVCHRLLTKMFSGNEMSRKMNFAFYQMRLSNKHQHRYVNSSAYSLLKRDRPEYVIVYKGRDVKYLHPENTLHLENYLADGWSTAMPEEYKAGRVGMGFGPRTSETKKRISEATKGRPSSWKGKKHPGHTPESLANLRLAGLKRRVPMSQESYDKHRVGWDKRIGSVSGPMSEDTKKKISDRALGRRHNPGRKYHKRTENAKRKTSESLKKTWALRKQQASVVRT